MQLLLTKTELQLLADLLEEKRYELTHGAQPPTDRETFLAREFEEMLGNVIDHDIHFSADELLDVSDMLSEYAKKMKQQGTDPGQYATLQSMLDKILECCAMV